MKKYKAEVCFRQFDKFIVEIEIDLSSIIKVDNNLNEYRSENSAKRAAERVAKKLNIALEWEK